MGENPELYFAIHCLTSNQKTYGFIFQIWSSTFLKQAQKYKSEPHQKLSIKTQSIMTIKNIPQLQKELAPLTNFEKTGSRAPKINQNRKHPHY